MNSQMMNEPLLITAILRHAIAAFPDVEIVSASGKVRIDTFTYRQFSDRAAQLSESLRQLGMTHSDRIGTLAWNTHRHLESYYAVSCSGAICHTINPRLFDDQIAFIINHAEDRFILTDLDFVPLLERLQERLPGVERYILLCEAGEMPATSLRNAICYETLFTTTDQCSDWPKLSEDHAASLCYTSGTTGDPKGVLYSHRSVVLHALASSSPNALGFSMSSVIMPIVPMFHVNAWGTPFSSLMNGSRLVLPGSRVSDGGALVKLIEDERVTHALGVPTVWLMILDAARRNPGTLNALEVAVVGGAACSTAIIREMWDAHRVEVVQAWGMTETSPICTVGRIKPQLRDVSPAAEADRRTKQGLPLFGVNLRILDESGNVLPVSSSAQGELEVQGPWVCGQYYRSPEKPWPWLQTGDIARIDQFGYLEIVDRSKDVIKSGGEWISSIELENIAQCHPEIAEAAVISYPHPKWQERPLLVVVKEEGSTVTKSDILFFFEDKVAKWWIPDEVLFVDSIPHAATGKISKRTLRADLLGSIGI